MSPDPQYPRRAILASALLLIALLPPAALAARETRETVDAPEAQAVFDGRHRALASEVLSAYPAARRRVTAALGWKVDFRPTLVLSDDAEGFRREAGAGGIVAYAYASGGPEGAEYIVVMDAAVLAAGPGDLEDTLSHELCHLVIARRVGEGRVPRWLNEGICEGVGGAASELRRAAGGRPLEAAALLGGLIPLARLERSFPSGPKQLQLAYVQAASAVGYVRRTYGEGAVPAVLSELGAGRDFQASVRAALGVSPEELEDGWRASLRGPGTMFLLFADNLEEALFALAGLAALAAFALIALKMRRRLREEGVGDGGAAEARWRPPAWRRRPLRWHYKEPPARLIKRLREDETRDDHGPYE